VFMRELSAHTGIYCEKKEDERKSAGCLSNRKWRWGTCIHLCTEGKEKNLSCKQESCFFVKLGVNFACLSFLLFWWC